MTMKRLTDKPVEWQGWKCHIDAGQYENGRIALELVVAKEHDQGIEGERITVASVNLVDAYCGPRQVFIKDWTENEGMSGWLFRHGIIRPEPVGKASSGFVVVHAYDLTDAAFAKLCGEPAPAEPEDTAPTDYLNERELATVLAALRYWQREGVGYDHSEDDIATGGRKFNSLDNTEIDALCERLNCGG